MDLINYIDDGLFWLRLFGVFLMPISIIIIIALEITKYKVTTKKTQIVATAIELILAAYILWILYFWFTAGNGGGSPVG